MKILVAFLLLPLSLLAQQTGSSLIFSQIGPSAQVFAQACQTPQLAYITDAAPGQNIYACTASANRQSPGTWTAIGGATVPNPSLNGAAYWNGAGLATTGTSGTGTYCVTSTNGGPIAFGSCSGAATTAWANILAGTNGAALAVGSGGSFTFSGTGIINANQLNGTALSSLATGILKNTAGTPSIAAASDFPILNQNSTGTSASITGVNPPANGGTGVPNTATLTLGTANQNWPALGTGIVKNTTATGAISDALAADVIGLFANCSGTLYLGADGSCHAPPSAALADPGATGIVKRTTLDTTVIAVAADFPILNQNTTGTAAVGVNGSSVPSPNFNAATPAAGSSNLNVTFHSSGSSISAELPYAFGLAVASGALAVNTAVIPSLVTLQAGAWNTLTSINGTTNYAACPSPVLTALTDQQQFFLRVDTANTSTQPTLNVCALGAFNVMTPNGLQPSAGRIQPGPHGYWIQWDNAGSMFRLVDYTPTTYVDAQSGASPTVPNTDRGAVFQTTNNTSQTNVTVPQVGAAGFGDHFSFIHCNTGSVPATDTPTTSTVNGNVVLSLLGAASGGNPECAIWWSDAGNWWSAVIPPTDSNGLLSGTAMPALSGAVANAGGSTVTTLQPGVVVNSNLASALKSGTAGTQIASAIAPFTANAVPKFNATGDVVASGVSIDASNNMAGASSETIGAGSLAGFTFWGAQSSLPTAFFAANPSGFLGWGVGTGAIVTSAAYLLPTTPPSGTGNGWAMTFPLTPTGNTYQATWFQIPAGLASVAYPTSVTAGHYLWSPLGGSIASNANLSDVGNQLAYAGSSGIAATNGPVQAGNPAAALSAIVGGGGFFFGETSATLSGFPVATVDGCYGNSTTHIPVCSWNNATAAVWPLLNPSSTFTANHVLSINASTNLIDDAGYLKTAVVLNNQANTYSTGLQDFSNTAVDVRLPNHSADPGACSTGQIEFNSTSAGFKGCTATNTWGSIGGGGLSGLTTGYLIKAASATTAANSLDDEGITTANVHTIGDTAGLAVPNGPVSAGSPPSCATPGTGGGPVCLTEGTAGTPSTGQDNLQAISAQHAVEVNNNNTGAMPVSRVAAVNVTPVTVSANVSTAQNLMAVSLNANLLNVAGRTFKVWLAGTYSNVVTSAPTVTLAVKLCTVSGCATGSSIVPLSVTSTATSATAVTNLAANLTGYITTQTAGATSAYESHGLLGIDLGTTNLTADSLFADTNTATVSAIDSTGALFLQTTVTFSAASASNSFTARQLIVEVLN